MESAEKTKDSRLARQLIVALPVELGRDDWLLLLRGFIQTECVDKGMCADFAIHDPDGHNPHMIQPEDEDSVRQRRTALRPDVAFEREQQLSHNGYIDNISIQIAQQIVDVQIVGDKISEKVQTSMAQHKEVPDR